MSSVEGYSAPRKRTIKSSTKRGGISRPGSSVISSRSHNTAGSSGWRWQSLLMHSALAVLVYVVCPVIIHLSPAVQNALVFLNYARPPFTNLSDPAKFGLSPARSFFLESGSEQLGVWHILPEGSSTPSNDWSHSLADGKPVILYMHGNAGTRGTFHRVELYKLFLKLGFHVVAFDYRGYGDSSGQPQNETVVNDALTAYRWTEHQATGPVFIWGHSLGTGVSVQAVSRLCSQGNCPVGLLLEAPFISVESAAATHPIGRPWSWLLKVIPNLGPYFFKTWNVQFNSLATIETIQCPIFVTHSADDAFIDIRSSEQLVERARETRVDKESVVYHAFDGYGHQYLYKEPNLPQLIREFVEKHGRSKLD